MRKLIIQIPCFNEEASLPITLSSLPREVDGVDCVEWLVVDDGSTDRTVDVALQYGVDHVVRLNGNRGLARAFMAGIEACLQFSADIIVNTDADNQYSASCIPSLVRPILNGDADFVVGSRPISEIEHFSPIKKLLQYLGSWVVRVASSTSVPDAPSGFRAMSREVAFKLNVFSDYTYTLETIIQAGQQDFRVKSVPIEVNPDLRRSRLVKNTFQYVYRSVLTVFRIFMIYKPFRAFFIAGATFLTISVLIGVRFLYLIVFDSGGEYIQSLILAAILSSFALAMFSIGILADLLAVNRTLLEDIRMRQLRVAFDQRHEEISSNKLDAKIKDLSESESQ